MRILVLSQWYPPEPQKVISDLTEGLQALGHDVTVLTGFPNYPTGVLSPGYKLKLWQKENINGVPIIRVPLYPDHSKSPIKRTLNFVSFAIVATLLFPLLAPRADIIHVIHPPLTIGLPAWVLSRFLRVPFTYEIHDMWPETLRATGMVRDRRILALVGWFAKRVYKRAAAIRVVWPGFREDLIDKGVPGDKIFTIHDWIDVDFYRPEAANPELAEKLGLAGKFNVMYAGTIGLAQGLETVLDAAELLQDIPDLQIAMVGDGIERKRLEKEAQERGLTNVKFLGWFPAEEMSSIYPFASVLLVHLRDDPLYRIAIPHKTFTYMASSKPALVALHGGAADLIESAQAGLACSPCNPREMANRLRQFHTMTHQERETMGANGRRVACELFSRDRLVAKTAEMLESVFQKHSLKATRRSRTVKETTST